MRGGPAGRRVPGGGAVADRSWGAADPEASVVANGQNIVVDGDLSLATVPTEPSVLPV
ncbi:hypothetical protein PS467_36090 [Streptomyces luomodiensis]|uniref:Uncharacterized protein n=1 Tax=Streptomyces luomodiensis TaxID=3026192 RepID=A0ABY9V6Y1_9ACTN|nr:hypothetical protein [Streptomyces sp. SCA4-21]WNF00362.1 hypothetical protein PS467_36090 [Streptomyces sp. SCA4-21]